MFRINGSRKMTSLVFEENGAMLMKYKDLFDSYFSSTFTSKLKDTIETPVKHYQKEQLNNTSLGLNDIPFEGFKREM